MKKLIFIFAFLFLSGCATDNPPQIIGMPRLHGGFLQDTISENLPEEVGPVAYTVWYKRGVQAELYEPLDGAYIGAWLAPENTIRVFEYESGKRHAVYVSEVFLGDEIDISWLLHCIASLATPMFVVHPPNNPELDDIPIGDLILHLAKRLGSFNLPMFVAFMPEHDLMPAEYSLLFRSSRNAFRAHAPMAAFVWVAPEHTATPQSAFYPGHASVDWVALPLLANWSSDYYFTDVLSMFENFYNAFHEYKPVMVFPFGVSHFTLGDYNYRLNPAADEISRLFNEFKNFPRLGMIIYADAFTILRGFSDDFSVSREPVLINAYAEAISSRHFLSSLERYVDKSTRWARSAYKGYFWEGRIYISQNTLENELTISVPRQTIEINENNFVDSRRISGISINICHNSKVIFVENTP
ncbi:MAG: hypothetical protein FWF81_10690 [Defluviitaleaceae bacterium]|nr:hypothetical protein [Defluviitaleaceae bacterium]